MLFPGSFCLGWKDWYLDHLVRCLGSIRKYTDAPVVLADLGSRHSRAVREIGRDFAVRVVDAPREVWSRSHALNVAAESLSLGDLTQTTALVFTDADMLFSARWFEVVGDLLNAPGAADPDRAKLYLTPSRDLDPATTADLGLWWMAHPPSDEALFEASTAHPSVGEGAAMIVPRLWFMRVGGFDEAYEVWGGEDNDMVLRAGWSGVPVEWLPDERACVFHQYHRRDWPSAEGFDRVRRNRAYLAERVRERGPIVRNKEGER